MKVILQEQERHVRMKENKHITIGRWIFPLNKMQRNVFNLII